MLKKSIILVLLFTAAIQLSDAQNSNNLKDINKVWEQFYHAFETLDHQPMADIHSKSLVRIAGGRNIIDYAIYINNYKSSFKASKDANSTNNISLRFFERISNDSVASERGVYKLVRNKGKSDEQTYYGQFHVIMKKENGAWKITMDYDSSESNSIGENEYNKAYGISEFDAFIKD